jgi:hypothetical protein
MIRVPARERSLVVLKEKWYFRRNKCYKVLTLVILIESILGPRRYFIQPCALDIFSLLHEYLKFARSFLVELDVDREIVFFAVVKDLFFREIYSFCFSGVELMHRTVRVSSSISYIFFSALNVSLNLGKIRELACLR